MRPRSTFLLLAFFAAVPLFAQTAPQASLTVSDLNNEFRQGPSVALDLTNASFQWSERDFNNNGKIDDLIISTVPAVAAPATATQRWLLQFLTNGDLQTGTYFIGTSDLQFVAELQDSSTSSDIICPAVNGSVTVSNLTEDTTVGATAPALRLKGFGASFTIQCADARALTGSVVLVPASTNPVPQPPPPPAPTPGGGHSGTFIGGRFGIPVAPAPETPATPTVTTPNILVILPTATILDGLDVATGGSADVAIRTVATSTGFPDGVVLSAKSDPAGLGLSFSPSTVPAPGSGTSTLTVTAANGATGSYKVTVTAKGANGATAISSFRVNIFCDPPTILGIDEPQTTVIAPGQTATLTAKPGGSGPFTYQWYEGFTGQTTSPVAGGNSATLTTAPLSNSTMYWVRIANGCGSVDSQSAQVLIPGH